jgi:superfamily I DNA/RNA helicase
MIPNAELLFGPPGTGKTYTLIKEVEKALTSGVAPDRIGYVSFTKKAISEARERACSQFNLDEKQLPWFRTLHSWGYNGIGVTHADMMGSEDWSVMRDATGLKFSGTSTVNPDDGILLPTGSFGQGDQYLKLIDRSRYRMVSILQEYNDSEARELHSSILKRVDQEYALYKSKMQKVDFVDLIELYIKSGVPPKLDLLIVDEAQDLTPLQWDMVKHIAPHSQRVIIAGDDDQAIHRWTGVEVSLFLNASDNVRVLNQSYRMPVSVHNLSQRIVHRIKERKQKDFLPTDEEGRVVYHMSHNELDLSQGSWTLMARTNSMVRDWAAAIKQDNHMLSVKGVSSVDQNCALALKTWERLRNGEGVELGAVKQLYSHVRKQGDGAVVSRGSSGLLDSASPDSYLTHEKLVNEYGMKAEKHWDGFEIARFGEQDRRYIEALQRRGEDITSKPRIKVSTFHRMKGGEDDNCVVFTGQSAQGDLRKTKYPDDEHRAFYVGLTRARKNLHILVSPSKNSYEL